MDETWRLLPFDLGPSDLHFAMSDALVRLAEGPGLWWHATDRPTLILGAGQRWTEADLETCELLGVRIIRRQAGGTAVLAADGVLGLDVVLPLNHPFVSPDVVETYRWIGEVWVAALARLGVSGHLVTVEEARAAAGRRQERRSVDLACFGGLSPYEVTVEGRKLVGLAQVRRSRAVLLQSGIHLRFDPHALAALLPAADRSSVERELAERAIGLREVVSRAPGFPGVMEAFARALEETRAVRLVAGEWSAEERSHACSRVVSLRPPEEATMRCHQQ